MTTSPEELQPDEDRVEREETTRFETVTQVGVPLSVGPLRLTQRSAASVMAVWIATVASYAHVSGFDGEFVFIAAFTGFIILVELTTSNEDAPDWHRQARALLVIGYVVYAVLLLIKLLTW